MESHLVGTRRDLAEPPKQLRWEFAILGKSEATLLDLNWADWAKQGNGDDLPPTQPATPPKEPGDNSPKDRKTT